MDINAVDGSPAMGRSLSFESRQHGPTHNSTIQAMVTLGSEEWSRAETTTTEQEMRINSLEQLKEYIETCPMKYITNLRKVMEMETQRAMDAGEQDEELDIAIKALELIMRELWKRWAKEERIMVITEDHKEETVRTATRSISPQGRTTSCPRCNMTYKAGSESRFKSLKKHLEEGCGGNQDYTKQEIQKVYNETGLARCEKPGCIRRYQRATLRRQHVCKRKMDVSF